MRKKKPVSPSEPGELKVTEDSMGSHWTYKGLSIYQMAGSVIVPALWVGRDTTFGTFTRVEEAVAVIDARVKEKK